MKTEFSILMMALSFGLVACGNSASDGTGSNSVNDTNSTNESMLDSGAKTVPANGMGDTTLFKDSNHAESTPGSANDSIKRIGGSSTSDRDSTRRNRPTK